jgi:hypothetical protein
MFHSQSISAHDNHLPLCNSCPRTSATRISNDPAFFHRHVWLGPFCGGMTHYTIWWQFIQVKKLKQTIDQTPLNLKLFLYICISVATLCYLQYHWHDETATVCWLLSCLYSVQYRQMSSILGYLLQHLYSLHTLSIACDNKYDSL